MAPHSARLHELASQRRRSVRLFALELSRAPDAVRCVRGQWFSWKRRRCTSVPALSWYGNARTTRSAIGDSMSERFPYQDVDVPRLLSLLGIDAQHDGDRWIAPCPEHEEKEPSWSMRDEPGGDRNGLHHCFGCKYQGTAIELTANVLGIQFGSAAEWIRERAMRTSARPLSVEVACPSYRRPKFRLPPDVNFGRLADWPTPVRRYVESRGITAAQVDEWAIGYALAGRLTGRIVLVARNASGHPVSYTARSFAKAPKRYLNPTEEERADTAAIWGEHLWPGPSKRKTIDLAITEGGFNALAVQRTGFGNSLAVASLGGSHVHLSQLVKLGTFRRVAIVTDPDLAGDRAAEFIEGALIRHVASVKRAHLPRGEDPNTMDPTLLFRAIQEALGR